MGSYFDRAATGLQARQLADALPRQGHPVTSHVPQRAGARSVCPDWTAKYDDFCDEQVSANMQRQPRV